MAQVDYFLKIDGVEAESPDAGKHKGEIEVESFSWGETQSGTAGHGSGGGAGKVVPQDFHFVKKLDKSSTRLFIACATGEHFKTAVLSARKAGGEQLDYFTVTMEEVLVSSYQLGGSAHSEIVPTDQVSLNFAKLAIAYKEQKPDGTLGAEATQGYDFAGNVKV